MGSEHFMEVPSNHKASWLKVPGQKMQVTHLKNACLGWVSFRTELNTTARNTRTDHCINSSQHATRYATMVRKEQQKLFLKTKNTY